MMDIEKLAREADPEFGNADGDMPDAIVGIEAIRRFAALVAEEAAKVCDKQAHEFGGVAEGRMAAQRGALVHEAMSAGSMACAAAIRERFKA